MGIMEQVENWVEKRSNPERRNLEVKNQAQAELIEMAGGADAAGVWIDANARRFDELIEDSNRNLIERLADKKTHTEALEEIKKNLYH